MSASIIFLPMVRVERADALVPVSGRISRAAHATLQTLAARHADGDISRIVSDLLEQCAAAAREEDEP